MLQKRYNNNLAKRVQTKLPERLTDNQPLSHDDQKLQATLKSIQHSRDHAQNKYQKVISALEQIIQQLLERNQFLNKDRSSLVRDNFQIRRKNESLSNIIQVKQRLGQSISNDSIDIFDIMVENKSAISVEEKLQEEYNSSNEETNLICNNQPILDRHEFIIQPNSDSNMSINENNQISMSNIGRHQPLTPANQQTPGLHHENIFIQCNTRYAQGTIRAFYLSAIQRKETVQHLNELIQSLKNDMTTIIFESYPTNQFWTELLCNFLKIIHQGHFDTQMEVLQYLKVHRLIDSLLIKCLKSRIQFLFSDCESFESPPVSQLLGALANEFGLRMQFYDSQYVFYVRQIRQDKLFSKQPSLQISLNSKEEMSKYYMVQEEPCFVIHEREQSLQLPFYIVLEDELGLSQYQINVVTDRQNHSFKYSQENQSFTEQIVFKGSDNLAEVVGILNQRDMNINNMDANTPNNKIHPQRYENSNQFTGKQYQSPLSSNRYSMKRVTSKQCDFDEFS